MVLLEGRIWNFAYLYLSASVYVIFIFSIFDFFPANTFL